MVVGGGWVLDCWPSLLNSRSKRPFSFTPWLDKPLQWFIYQGEGVRHSRPKLCSYLSFIPPTSFLPRARSRRPLIGDIAHCYFYMYIHYDIFFLADGSMASGGGKMEIKAKIQSKSYSAISDLIALEKVVVRGSKSKDVSISTEQYYFLYWEINKGDGFFVNYGSWSREKYLYLQVLHHILYMFITSHVTCTMRLIT